MLRAVRCLVALVGNCWPNTRRLQPFAWPTAERRKLSKLSPFGNYSPGPSWQFPKVGTEPGTVTICMKSETIPGLENAAWPALLVDSAGAVRQANQAAIELFGLSGEGASGSLSAIWSSENATNPEQFLAYWELSPAPSMPVKLRVKAGEAVSYLASICIVRSAAQDYFLMQLLPERGPSLDRSAGGETTMVHRQ